MTPPFAITTATTATMTTTTQLRLMATLLFMAALGPGRVHTASITTSIVAGAAAAASLCGAGDDDAAVLMVLFTHVHARTPGRYHHRLRPLV